MKIKWEKVKIIKFDRDRREQISFLAKKGKTEVLGIFLKIKISLNGMFSEGRDVCKCSKQITWHRCILAQSTGDSWTQDFLIDSTLIKPPLGREIVIRAQGINEG